MLLVREGSLDSRKLLSSVQVPRDTENIVKIYEYNILLRQSSVPPTIRTYLTLQEGNPVKEERPTANPVGLRHYIRTTVDYLLSVVTTRGVRLRALVVYYIWVVSTAPYYSLSHFSGILR